MGPKLILCLGEALVDFVCERPVASLGDADFFVPRQGGSLANIAVTAARFGGKVEMHGGAGDDDWGRWLRDRLAREGVGVDAFQLVQGAGTSHAFVAVSEEAEPSFAFYGDVERPAAYAGDRLDAALCGEPGVLAVGSDTLLGDAEREVTMRAAALGRERGWQVLCDPNLRPKRWATRDEMITVISDLLTRASVVKLNELEALELTACDGVEDAGTALLSLGPSQVVVTQSARGALVFEGGSIHHVAGCDATVIDATGAGDSVAGVIAAGLANGVPVAEAASAAMEVAARVVGAWGATAGLPSAEEARALLPAPAA